MTTTTSWPLWHTSNHHRRGESAKIALGMSLIGQQCGYSWRYKLLDQGRLGAAQFTPMLLMRTSFAPYVEAIICRRAFEFESQPSLRLPKATLVVIAKVNLSPERPCAKWASSEVSLSEPYTLPKPTICNLYWSPKCNLKTRKSVGESDNGGLPRTDWRGPSIRTTPLLPLSLSLTQPVLLPLPDRHC